MNALLQSVVNFVAPPICPCCHRDLTEEEGVLCSRCDELFLRLPEEKRCPNCGGIGDDALSQCHHCLEASERPWQIGVSAFEFRGLARVAIHRLKFRKQLALARFFGKEMARNWVKFGAESFKPDVVTAVPLHWIRRWIRGYNQSEEVAKFLASELSLPYVQLLKRCRYTKAQATLQAKKRQNNLRNAFDRTAKMDAYHHKNILLVDDVFTTGSTLAAAADALLAHGARSVAVCTIARD